MGRDTNTAITYRMPTTQFAVTAVRHDVVEVRKDAASKETRWLTTRLDVSVQPSVIPDGESAAQLTLDIGLLEKINLKIELDDRGLIEALNAEAGRDIGPIISLIGKLVPLISVGIGVLIAPEDEKCLEEQWEIAHPLLAKWSADLQERITDLLNQLVETDDLNKIADIGTALDVLQAQHGAIQDVRLAWIAEKDFDYPPKHWLFSVADLAQQEEQTTLPETRTSAQLASPAFALTEEVGFALALVDPHRPEQPRPQRDYIDKDKIWIRRARPVGLGIYLKDDDPKVDVWSLDKRSISYLDIVDEHSADDEISVDGSWWRDRGLELSFHPDRSVKTFGVSTTNGGATATAFGDLAEAVTSAVAPTPEESEDGKQRARGFAEVERLSLARKTS